MSIRAPLIANFCLIAAMLGIAFWTWQATPPDVRIAVHWGMNGEPNGFAPKAALFLMPAIALGMCLVFVVLPSLEPRRANLVSSRKLYFAGWIGGMLVLTVTQFLIASTAVGHHPDILRTIFFMLGCLHIVLGNFFGKSRSMFFVGLRLPWTLSSELAWEKSNRLLGRIFVATGFVTLLSLFLDGTAAAIAVFTIGTALGAVASAATAYVYWKRDGSPSGESIIHE